MQRPQARCPLCLQKPEAPINKYLSQTKTHQQWEAEMERLNTKYNLDCFSESELDSESDEGEHITTSMGMRHLFERCPNTEVTMTKFCDNIVFKMQLADCSSEK